MEAAPPPDPVGDSAHILLALRHALADPLSAATLKLDLVERRLMTAAGADPSWVMGRVRAAQIDVAAANRLLDLLLRLAEIAGERPARTSLRDVCRTAGVPLSESPAASLALPLRHTAAADAIRSVASFAARGNAVTSPMTAGLESGRVTLAVEGARFTADGRPERLLDLPHGIAEAETLFVARAAAVLDGGRLDLIERGEHLVAVFSWPVSARENAA